MFKTAVAFHNYVDATDLYRMSDRTTVQTDRKSFTVEERTLSFDFYPHYHPYASELTRRLIQSQVPGLLAADTAYVKKPDGSTEMLDPKTPRPELWRQVFSDADYAPSALVDHRPVEDLDFTSAGPYSVYNWELFFHVPLTIAIHLSRNGRYPEAQRWFHFVFDPTDDSEGPTPERFWKVRPFQYSDVKLIEQILVNLSTGEDAELRDQTILAIGAWKDAPFRPHAVARHRQTAYMLKTVMAYLDNCLVWHDSLLREDPDSRETITEAMQPLVLAANILGPRSQVVPRKGSVRPQTYASLRKDLDKFGNALRDVEADIPFDLTPHPSSGAGGDGLRTLSSIGTSLYFCVPRNDRLLQYWDTVADRLFKIRNSLSIEGVFRQLSLFEPPIDPALLAKAAAAGVDIRAVVSEGSQPLPLVNFQHLLETATKIVDHVQALGDKVLSAIEKEDGEALAVLRATQERVLLSMGETVKYGQLQEAVKAREGLERSLAGALERYVYYERLLGEDGKRADGAKLDPLDTEALDKKKLKASEPGIERRDIKPDIATGVGGIAGGQLITSHEQQELLKMADSQSAQDIAAGLEAVGAMLNVMPQFSVDGKPLGVGAGAEIGGINFGHMMSALATVARGVGGRAAYEANRAGKIAGYASRTQERESQSNEIAPQAEALLKQLRAAQIHEAVVQRELENHKQQTRQAEDIERFLTDERTGKHTNQAFCAWHKREARGLHSDWFQLAFDAAHRTQRALQHELGDPSLSIVGYGYMGGRDGLLAGEKLQLDLHRMSVAYQGLNELELVKQISLLQVDPRALLQLRETGTCTFTLPEELFDLDCPGHYFRRIKSLALSIPAVAGPGVSVNCTVTLLKSTIRRSPLLSDGEYARNGADDERFSDHFGALESFVTSTARNDHGRFQPDGGDGRRLPCAGAGCISQVQLEMNARVPQFDLRVIPDVNLQMALTARPGGALLRARALDNLEQRIDGAEAAGSLRLLSMRHEFPTEWARFKTADTGGGKLAPLTIELRREHYPFWARGRLDELKQLLLFARTDTNLSAVDPQDKSKKDSLTVDASLGLRVGSIKNLQMPDPLGELTLSFDSNAVDDLWLGAVWGKA